MKGVSLVKKIKFEDIILQNACNYINNVIEIFKKLLEEGMDIRELSLKVREMVDKLGIETMVAIIEELDKIIKEDKRRKEKWVVEREDEKTFIAFFITSKSFLVLFSISP